MKLRVIFLGDEAKQLRQVTAVLHDIDQQLFDLEGKTILALGNDFPQLSAEKVQAAYTQYDSEYEAGVSLLAIEAVRRGSLIIDAVVLAAAYKILEATILKDIEKAYSDSNLRKKVQTLLKTDIKLHFIKKCRANLIEAVESVKKLYSANPNATQIKGTRTFNEGDCEVLEVEVQLVTPLNYKSYYELVEEYNSYLPDEKK